MNGTQDPLTLARFWSKVDVKRPNECWPWQEKSRHENGYGLFTLQRPERRTQRAHRFAYEIFNGPVPEGLLLRHTCDNPACCNPAHLLAGTHAENMADMHERKRRLYAGRYSESEIADMKRRVAAGETQTSVAKRYGCRQSYVSMVISGRRGASISKGIHYVR